MEQQQLIIIQGLKKQVFFVLFVVISVTLIGDVGGVPTTSKIIKSSVNSTIANNNGRNISEMIADTTSTRVKRGYSSGHSTGIAYNRINDAGQVRLGGGRGGGGGGGGHDEDEDGHRGGGGGGRRGGRGRGEGQNPVGEDGTHTNDFKSYGVGYEHRNTEHCEESKCGYNIRHCPHGCVFNSLLCGGGRSYDTCCC